MNLRVIKGLDGARKELSRVDPLDLGAIPEAMAHKTREVFGEDLPPVQAVQRILADVQQQGDGAVRYYASKFDGVDLKEMEVSRHELDRAYASAPPALVEALETAARRIEEFHRATTRSSWVDLKAGLGELVLPLERVGIYAPGGSASYPSTVLMTAIPARVAGVEEIVLATPGAGQGKDGRASAPAVLAAARIAGVDRVFNIGGVQAIGALAYGTETVPAVDKICGPGNIFVTLAKKLVFGQVDIDGLYGPTETVIVADETASAVYCAADMIAQAEHDPMASAILITTSLSLVAEVEGEVERQLATLERGDLAGVSLERQGKVVLVDSLDQALELSNHIAPEHLCLMVRDPWAWSGKVRHAGGVFLGSHSPEVMGDYVAGPSHVMPTGGTARFSSALSVHHFLKTMPVVGIKPEAYSELAGAAAAIARAEGLTGHARAVEVRLSSTDRQRHAKDGPVS